MGLAKVKCKNCNQIIDEEEIGSLRVDTFSNKIVLSIECYKCGENKEVEIELPDFFEISREGSDKERK